MSQGFFTQTTAMVIQSTPLLAQACAGLGCNTVNNAATISDMVSTSLDNIWEQALTGPLYGIINNVGVLLAIACVGFWCFKFYREMEEGGLRPAAVELVFPIVVIFLLSSGGSNLSKLTMGMRSYINATNQQIIQSVGANLDFQKSLSNLANYSTAQSQISQLRSRCDGITSNEKLQQCLQESKAQAEQYIETYKKNSPPGSWLQDLQQQFQQAFSDPLTAASTVVRTAMSPIMFAIEAFMVALQGAFQYAIEISMLITGLFGPIAVGLSLLPFGAKPIYAWMTGFWSLGLCKMSLNLVTGLVATTAQNAGPTGDTLGHSIAIGLLSPILAIGLSTGGGIAIFNGICAASSAVVSTGINVGTNVYGRSAPRSSQSE